MKKVGISLYIRFPETDFRISLAILYSHDRINNTDSPEDKGEKPMQS